MDEGEGEKIRLGVSSCLLGEEVRFDGGHKRDLFLTDVLGPFVDWVPVCPEVEIGLGIPRDTIRLVGDAAAPRLVVEKTGEDLTARMRRYAEAKVRALEALGLHGYVLKRASPSCGLFRVRVHHPNGLPSAAGRGLYAEALVARFPLLPIEEEGRLTDAGIRENFVERVFAVARWRRFLAAGPRPRDLVAFHAAQKLAVLAHSPAHYAALGRLVARTGRALTRAALDEYGTALMEALAVRATRARHTNVLQHLAGYVKRELDAPGRAELAEAIQEYRRGLAPLVVPLTLVRHYVRRFGVASLADQVYLDPHPKELMLRNHV
ncbi:MAG: hypothetical protein A3F92_07240 [Candidatus Rokubacteria bacterium RIFCSPLOWO2_12_FULL_71_22]|nr:MAG: hypothetical protein A3I17_08420 [Candidatus Rokubacteria bacterium RIFCSPLOWO2_02_FULL_72_37]OGL14523.1 MAG: hypothetical protein A3F92_07240 [Candidatus Rokubacteria bacterium RIFCSPLOWO2_12_FULL_71_22]